MAMAVGDHGGGPAANINVTPLIDVLLVLPKDKQKQQEPNDRTIVVQVVQAAPGQRPKLKVNQDDETWEHLGQRLTDIFKTRAERVMFVKGDDEVPFSDVAQVIDIAHAAGVDKVGLITAKIEAGQ